MSNLSKPIQTEGLLAIRQTIDNIIADSTQGPLFKAALRAALDLPYKNLLVAGASVTLDYDTHNGAIVELEAADTVVSLPAQASYSWPGLPMIVTLRSEFPFTIVAGAAVDVNGEIAETWECEAWPAAITLHWRAEDEWGLTGPAAVAP